MAFLYRKGPRQPIRVPLDGSSAAIAIGDAVTITNATDGYFKEVDASGEKIFGIAMQAVASPTNDGDATVLVDISPLSVYEVPPDTGTVTQALAGNSADCGADARSVNIDASTQDDVLILEVDTAANRLRVCILHSASLHAGVA